MRRRRLLAWLAGLTLSAALLAPAADALATTGPAHQGLVALEQAGLPTGILTRIEVLVPGIVGRAVCTVSEG